MLAIVMLGFHYGMQGQVTYLSVLEVAPNYGIDSVYLTDTNNFQYHLNAQEQNYIALASECVDLSSKIQNMLYSLQHDYEHDQKAIWINHKSAINDFATYEPILIDLQQRANRLSKNYLQMEQNRIIEAERQAQIMAEEERASKQEGRNIEAKSLKKSIDEQHALITEKCKQSSLSKQQQKERKDLYYTYLAIYNGYDFTVADATESYLQQLTELRNMQRDMLDSVICDKDSYTQRIEGFPSRLKDSCGLRHNDVYRSYTRVFYHTTVPIAFTNLSEYYRYTQKLRDIAYTQDQYLKAVNLRDSIRNNTDTLHARYWKRYKNILSAYDEMNSRVNTLPSFTTRPGSIQFIADLRDYIDVQELYRKNFKRLEAIDERADSINALASGYKMSDIKKAYSKLPKGESFVPHFGTLVESIAYDSTLDDFEQVQANYMKIIALRKIIQDKHDQILDGKNNERVFSNGYKKIRDKFNFTPSCTYADEAYFFVSTLLNFIYFQDQCKKSMVKRDSIQNGEKAIKYYEGLRPNIYKAYKNLMKSCPSPDKIETIEEMEGYDRLLDYRILIQDKLLTIFKSSDAEEIDYRIKGMSTLQVKQILGLTE